MADSLLEALGLQPGKLPKVAGPDGRLIDLNLPPGYDPGKAAAGPGAPARADGQPAATKKPEDLTLPSDPQKQIDVITQALRHLKDPVKQDPLVKALKDAISKVPQPFFTREEFKKKLDDAIDAAIDAGAKALLKAAIEAVTHQKVDEPDDDDMPGMPGMPDRNAPKPDEAPGQFILKTPKIPLPWDQPKPPPQPASFQFKGLPKTAKAGGYASFTLTTPGWWDPGKFPGTWVVALSAADFKAEGDGARSTRNGTHVDQRGSLKLSLTLPDEPGAYVIVVKVQSGYEHDPVEPITLN